MRKSFVIISFLWLFCLSYSSAQIETSNYALITSENVGQLTELAAIGRGTIKDLMWTLDSRYIIAVDDAGFYFYDPEDMHSLENFIEDKTGRLGRNLSQSPDGRLIAGHSPYRSDIILWDLTHNGQTTTFSINSDIEIVYEEERLYGVQSASFSPDGATIVIGTFNGRVYVWGTEQHNDPILLETTDLDLEAVKEVAFTPDGQWLAACYDDGVIRMWDTSSWEHTTTLSIPDTEVWYSPCMAFNKTHLLTKFLIPPTDEDRAIVALWSIPKGEMITSREVAEDTPMGFDKDGKAILVTSGTENSTQLLELETGAVRWEIKDFSQPSWAHFALTSDRLVAFSYGADGTWIDVFSMTDGQEILSDFVAYTSARESVSPDGHYLAVSGIEFADISGWGYDDTPLRVWNLYSGELVDSMGTHAISNVGDFVFSPDSSELALAGYAGFTSFWTTSNRELQRLDTQSDYFMSMPRITESDPAFNADGTLYKVHAASSNGLTINLFWDVPTRTYLDQDLVIRRAALHPSQMKMVALVARDDPAHPLDLVIFDLSTWQEIISVPAKSEFQALVYSPDGSLVAGLQGDHRISIWDAETLELRHTFTSNLEYPDALAFSPDSYWLKVAMVDALPYLGEKITAIELWDATTGEQWEQLNYVLSDLEFSADGIFIAAVDYATETLLLWNRALEEETVPETMPLENVRNVTFSPDGKLLAIEIATDDGIKVVFWDTDKEIVAGELSGHAKLFDVHFSPMGDLIAVRSTGRRIIVYGISS